MLMKLLRPFRLVPKNFLWRITIHIALVASQWLRYSLHRLHQQLIFILVERVLSDVRVVPRGSHFLLSHRPAYSLELQWLWAIRLLLKLNLLFQKLSNLGILHKLLKLVNWDVVLIPISQLGDHLGLAVLGWLLLSCDASFLQILFARVLDRIAVGVVLALNHLLIWKLLLFFFGVTLQICVPSNCAHFRILVHIC